MIYFPIMLNLAGRLAVVVGGGPVGRRKAVALQLAKARVRLVTLNDPESAMSDWQVVIESYRPEHLECASLVFAAATPAVNARVVADARARGIWVNSADSPAEGDFVLPSTMTRGDLQIAVSTGGAAPNAAKNIREMLEEQFDESWAGWLALQKDMRGTILASVADPAARTSLFTRLADLNWVHQFRAEGADAVRIAMLQVVEEARTR